MTTGRPSTAAKPRAGAGLAFPGAEALIEEARQRQRRRWWRRGVLAVSLALLAAASAAGALGLSGPAARVPGGGAAPAPPGPVAAIPPRVVVYTAGWKIEVLSSRTGRPIRTLATNVALYRGSVTLAVSPAGVVYFDDARGRGQWIRSVPLAGGTVTTIAEGDTPAISPDGRLLAYVTYTARTCGGPCAGKPEAIVVRDLPAGTQKTWAFTSTLPDINSLSWSPDGRFLAFAGTTLVQHGTVTVRTAQVLDTRSGGSLDAARRIPLGRTVAWAGILTSRTGLGVMVGADGTIQSGRGLFEVGVSSGRVLRRLTSLPPHGLATDNAFDGTEHTITADRSGRYLLLAGMGTGTGQIFRWTFGMRRPVLVTSGALYAVWAD